MSKQNLAIVKKLYDAAQQGDMDTILSLISPEFVMYEADGLPFAGTYHGSEGFSQFVEAFANTWSEFSNTELEVLDANPYVIGLSKLRATGKRSGETIEVPLAEFFRVEGDHIVELRPFYFDGAAVARAGR